MIFYNDDAISFIQNNKKVIWMNFATYSFLRSSYLDSFVGSSVENDGVIEAGVRRKLNRREREYERSPTGEKTDPRGGREDDPRALEKVGVAVGRSPDDSLELILRGGFGKGAAAAAAASEGCE